MRFLLIFLLISQLLRMFRGSQVIFKTKNMECTTNPKYAENSSCLIKAINWNKSVAQMDVDLKIELRNVLVQMQFFKKGYNNRYNPFLINVEFNICDVISKRNYIAYGKILVSELKKFTNVNNSCPVTGHLMARDLYIRETLWPIFPLGFYLASYNFIENFKQQASESIGVVKVYFEAMEKVETRRKPKV